MLAVLTPSCHHFRVPPPVCVVSPAKAKSPSSQTNAANDHATDARILATEVPPNEAWLLVDNLSREATALVDDAGRGFGMIPPQRHAIVKISSAGSRAVYAYSTSWVSLYGCASRDCVGAIQADFQLGCVYLAHVAGIEEAEPTDSAPSYRCGGLGFLEPDAARAASLTNAPPVWVSGVSPSTGVTPLAKDAAAYGAMQLARGPSIHNARLVADATFCRAPER